MKRLVLGAMLVLLTALVPRGATAKGCNGCLGTPTNTVSPNQYFPLSGFARMKGEKPPVLAGKPEVLFIGTQLQDSKFPQDETSAVERWPLVKALEQFGRFSGLERLPRYCFTPSGKTQQYCDLESFNWHGARYTSPYISFAGRELLKTDATPLDSLSGQELALYKKYSRAKVPFYKHDPLHALTTVLSGGTETTRQLPLVVIGNYRQTIDQIVTPGAFRKTFYGQIATPGESPPVYYTGFSFTEVQGALAAGTANALTLEVNAQANVMTALICHADGGKPKTVCGRAVIKTILKQVK
jgi:hypothetical protein